MYLKAGERMSASLLSVSRADFDLIFFTDFLLRRRDLEDESDSSASSCRNGFRPLLGVPESLGAMLWG